MLESIVAAVDCGNPGVPANGAKQGGAYTYGSTVTFQCQPGYKLRGSGTIQCQAAGTWNAPLPQCIGTLQAFHVASVSTVAGYQKFKLWV